MNGFQQRVLSLRNILPFVHKHKSVAGKQPPPGRRQHAAQRVAVRGIHPLHIVLGLVLSDRLAVQPARNVRTVCAFSEFRAAVRLPQDLEKFAEQFES